MEIQKIYVTCPHGQTSTTERPWMPGYLPGVFITGAFWWSALLSMIPEMGPEWEVTYALRSEWSVENDVRSVPMRRERGFTKTVDEAVALIAAKLSEHLPPRLRYLSSCPRCRFEVHNVAPKDRIC